MQVAYGIADLQHPSLHIFFRLRSLLAHHLVKRLALNVVHHHIDVILGFLEVHDVHDAGMAEPRKQVGFTRQALLDRTASRVGCAAVNLLDGPLLVAQPKVGCKEHPARAAPADKAENLVAALYDIALNQAAPTMLAHQRSLPPSRGKASAVASPLSLRHPDRQMRLRAQAAVPCSKQGPRFQKGTVRQPLRGAIPSAGWPRRASASPPGSIPRGSRCRGGAWDSVG